jgi:hypothetical protein
MNSPSFQILSRLSPREEIETKTRGEIEVYVDGRGKTRIHEGARNLSLNVSDDYGNRFLVELIQNAHDAHPAGSRDGEIAIVFDPAEGDFGCLYVANRGQGFTKENFLAITNIALSSKPVNESIGNKGLGFRSVLQICQSPEVYSVDGEGGRGEFDGYCFRFATQEDVAAFLDRPDATKLAKEINENMPCWYLPVYASDRPGQVSRFAREGFASVVRVPLTAPKARDVVLSQIEAMLGRERPLHLFLDRISRIGIERQPGKRESLERKRVGAWPGLDGVLFERLEIGDDEYLVANYTLDDARFKKQLAESLLKKEIPEAWSHWKGAANVSIAVRLGTSVENGVLYCFLPLGDGGKAPFAGYINANFYTKMDRRSVNDGVGLNKYFIDEAARLSCRAIDFLIEQNWPESPGAVIDLMCWSHPYAEVIHKAFGGVQGGFLDRPLLPVLSDQDESRWESVRKTVIWNAADDKCLSSDAVMRVGNAAVLHSDLSSRQMESLVGFFLAINVRFAPSAVIVAEWIEQVAKQMNGMDLPGSRWADFYDEIAQYLRLSPAVLFGRKFLLSINGDLIAAELNEGSNRRRRAADVYFPPVMTVDADTDDAESRKQLPLEQFPVSLKHGFALLSRDIPWNNPTGGYRPARAFFLEAKIVREYDTRDVIRTLAGITVSEASERTKEQALEWAFRLWSSGRSLSDKETRGAGFFVPTRTGWKSCEAAMFGQGWAGVINGKRLEGFLKAASEQSSELEELRGSLLPTFSDWPVAHGGEDEWIRFLNAAGVREYLRPVGGEARIQKDGQCRTLITELVRASTAIPVASATLWQAVLIKAAQDVRFPTVSYRADFAPWRIPGQTENDRFSTETKKEFAYQVVHAIGGLGDEHLKFRVFRPGNPSSGSVSMFWPTPLMCLLNDTEWMPVVRGGGTVRFVTPKEAWHFNTDDEALPRFMEIVAPSVAKAFGDGTLERLRLLVGLRILNDQRDVLQALLVYAETARTGLTDAREVKRFRELFGDIWTQVAPLNEGVDLEKIPVVIGGRIEAFDLNVFDSDEKTQKSIGYFIDEDDAAKKRLLEELEQPVFDFGKADPDDTWGWLEVLAPNRFFRVSDEKLDVLVDGIKFDATANPPLLSEVFGAWIVDFIVCIASHKGGKFFHATQSTLSKVRRAAMSLRLHTGRRLQISMGGTARDLPDTLHGAVVVWLEHGAVLITRLSEPKPTISLLSKSAEQLASALQYPMLANALDASLLRLSTLIHGNEYEPPSDEEIADALGTTAAEIEHTRKYVRTDLSVHARFALLLAACLGGDTERLMELVLEDEPAEESIRAAFEPIAALLGSSMDNLIERLGLVADPKELMQEFELPLAKLNEEIRKLPGEFKPISNEHAHKRQMEAYLFQNGERIIERIRHHYASRFTRGEGLEDYVRLRDSVSRIQPNPDWHEHYDELPDELLENYVVEWLHQNEISDSPEETALLLRRECRELNLVRLREFWQRYGKVLSAWVRYAGDQSSAQLRETWNDPSGKRQEFAARANSEGWLDFELLDDQAIVKRLESFGLWPSGKPLSADFADWGLSEEEIRDGEDQLKREREAARARRLKLNVDGQEFSAIDDDFGVLIEAVTSRFSDTSAFEDISGKLAGLSDIEKPSGGGGTGGGTGGRTRRPADSSMSDEQKKAIGLIGEVYAKEWIKRLHRENHGLELDDSCWVSGYRNIALGSESGNDSLGYDFIVRRKSVTYYYEVKASMADSHVFEMGPTEIATAHRFRSGKEHKYWVIYVANVTNHQRVEISLLPNPFSKEGERTLRPVGRGSVTFEFTPDLRKA